MTLSNNVHVNNHLIKFLSISPAIASSTLFVVSSTPGENFQGWNRVFQFYFSGLLS